MPKVEISREKIVEVLESKSPKSLTEVYRHLGGQGKLSGSVAGELRSLVDGIDDLVASNKAGAGTAKSEGEPKGNKPTLQTSGKSKGPKQSAKERSPASKSKVPRHPKNPFREGSGYGLIVDLLAQAGAKGIGKPELIKAYAKYSGKKEINCRYDLAVILSASSTSEKIHRSCRSGFVIERESDHLRIKFN